MPWVACRLALILTRQLSPVFGRLPDISPMLAALVAEPFHRDGWVYEEKVDGWRIVAHKEGDHVWLVSRTGRNHAGRFLEIDRVREVIRDYHFDSNWGTKPTWLFTGAAS